MKDPIKICKCRQCMSSKKRKRTNVKKFFKRMLNKKRRKSKNGDVTSFCYA